MKILLLMDPFIPVPPLHYGGVERVIYDIACQYVQMGHEVTLIAGPGSRSPGQLLTYGENSDILPITLDWKQVGHVSQLLWREIGRHDVLHNFGRLAWLFPVAWSGIRKVQTYMRYIAPRNIRALSLAGARNLTYTAVSDAIANTGRPGGGDWRTVYNCAPLEQFTYVPEVAADAPLVFLGRLERCKGAHTAIEVAKISGRRLVIAGNISAIPEEREYFEKELQPHFSPGVIDYIGVVDNVQKNRLLGSAAAMLLPVQWFEPFPIVIPESYACGTPVLAFRGGGVPEGISNGITGLLSSTAAEMASQVALVPTLSRAACQRAAHERYSDRVIANDYLNIYRND